MIILVLIWIIATLAMASIAVVAGRIYGKSIPIGIMAGFIVTANVLASKLVVFGPFTVPAGVLVFSATFLITDLFSEFWGKRYAQQAVWSGLLASIFFAISAIIAIRWPIAPFMAGFQEQFSQVLGLTPRIVVASLLAYTVSQNHDVWAYHWWKRKTKGKHLWLRNNASTVVSQGFDSVIFVTVAFAGVAPIVPIIIGNYVVKVLIAVVDTPFIYLIRWISNKINKKVIKKKIVAKATNS